MVIFVIIVVIFHFFGFLILLQICDWSDFSIYDFWKFGLSFLIYSFSHFWNVYRLNLLFSIIIFTRFGMFDFHFIELSIFELLEFAIFGI